MRVFAASAVLACLATSAQAEEVPPERSPHLALLLPLGVTGLGVGLVGLAGLGDPRTRSEDVVLGVGAAALLAGPPLGRIYARDLSWFGLGLQASGAFMILTAATDNGSTGIAILGVGVYSVGALYQILSAPRVVHRANMQRMTIVPTTNTNGAGLSLVGSF